MAVVWIVIIDDGWVASIARLLIEWGFLVVLSDMASTKAIRVRLRVVVVEASGFYIG